MEEKDTVAVEEAVRRGRDMLEKELQSFSNNLPPYLMPFTSGWIYAKILSQCVEYLVPDFPQMDLLTAPEVR